MDLGYPGRAGILYASSFRSAVLRDFYSALRAFQVLNDPGALPHSNGKLGN